MTRTDIETNRLKERWIWCKTPLLILALIFLVPILVYFYIFMLAIFKGKTIIGHR